MHVTRGETALFYATLDRDPHRGKVENHAVNDGPRRKTDLA
jgi:hypothetical protein